MSVADQKAPLKSDGNRDTRERPLRRARALGVNVQMRLAGFSRIADLPDLLTYRDTLARLDAQAARAKMTEQDVDAVAEQEDMVAGRITFVDHGHRHVGAVADCHHNLARTGRQHGCTEVWHRWTAIGRLDTSGAKSPAIDGDQIDTVATATEPCMQGIAKGRSAPHAH